MKFLASNLVLLLCLCCAKTYAGTVKFSQLVVNNHVADTGITVEYKDDEHAEFKAYESCEEKKNYDNCPVLNNDDDSVLRVNFTLPSLDDLNTLQNDGDDALGKIVKYKVMGCYENEFKNRRKWRKPKDKIPKDKRCGRTIVEKTDFTFAEGGGPTAVTNEHEIKTETPAARFFLTVYFFCQKEGKDGDQYCLIDTTGELKFLANKKDIGTAGGNAEELYKSTEISERLQYRTDVIDSRPPGLIAGVVVLSCCSVGMLIGYFVFEKALKKTN